MLPRLMLNVAMLSVALATTAPASDEALKKKVVDVFEEWCTSCHDSSDDLNLEGDPTRLVGVKADGFDAVLLVPGDPQASYLLTKMTGKGAYAGDLMPQGDDPLPAATLQVIADWITSIEPTTGEGSTAVDAGTDSTDVDIVDSGASGDADAAAAPGRSKGRSPFHGTQQIVLPTTSTLGKMTLQYHIDHRFARIGTERGFLGLDAGAVMSLGVAYGIFDGWDVRIRRTNSLKGWEFGTKYVPVRQEAGMPLSLGFDVSLDAYREFVMSNRVSGNFVMMLSRLWFDRWSTMLTVSYSTTTNHAARPTIVYDEADGAVPVRDRRGTLAIGIASSVWLGKKKRWGIDLEYIQPIPDGRRPENAFYYLAGDTNPDPDAVPIGAWSLGGSYSTGKHFFQIFISNNRQIHLNQAVPGGQAVNPFRTPGVSNPNTPFNHANFYLGFNLERRFTLGKNAARWKKERQAKKQQQSAAAPTAREVQG